MPLRPCGESDRLKRRQTKGTNHMITTFLLGAIAGFAAAPAEARLKPFVTQYLSGPAPSAVELRAISLAVCMLAAAFVAYLADGGGALALTFGGLIGVLWPRLQAKIRAARAPDYDS